MRNCLSDLVRTFKRDSTYMARDKHNNNGPHKSPLDHRYFLTHRKWSDGAYNLSIYPLGSAVITPV